MTFLNKNTLVCTIVLTNYYSRVIAMLILKNYCLNYPYTLQFFKCLVSLSQIIM